MEVIYLYEMLGSPWNAVHCSTEDEDSIPHSHFCELLQPDRQFLFWQLLFNIGRHSLFPSVYIKHIFQFLLYDLKTS
jgi:hypothetical protein